MAGNEIYTIRAGDTLSKVARRYGLATWQDIYDHEKNADFRAKRPNPDKIEPGDKVWVPAPPSGELSAAVLKTTRFVRAQGTLSVSEIRFDAEEDICYVRFDKSNRDYIAPDTVYSTGKTYAHISPKIYPEPAQPHWKHDPAQGKAVVNWPALYIRDGGGTGLKRGLSVSFRFDPPFKGSLHIKASGPEGIAVAEKKVDFDKGVADAVSFEFTKLPATVRKLAGIDLRWSFRKPNQTEAVPGAVTKHTFFIVDAKPIPSAAGWFPAANLIAYEICDWSCTWANGKKGTSEVLPAIWEQFNPVKAQHITGFVYWKDHENHTAPAADLESAIQRLDKDEPVRNAINCQAFDYIYIHSLCLHGIKAAEIALALNDPSRIGFSRNSKKHACESWNGKSAFGQGNPNGPKSWRSHWIADVFDHTGAWQLYDPSYGGAACISDKPIPPPSNVNVLKYELASVKDFNCIEQSTGARVLSTPVDDALVLPHLRGSVQWVP